MEYLNQIYTALMDGRGPAYPWGRRVSADALRATYTNEVTVLADLLVPPALTDREAAAVSEQLIDLWKRSAVPYSVEDTDPKNTYESSVLAEFTSDELKMFVPSVLLVQLGSTINFTKFPELKELYIDEPYWLDRLAAVVAYVVKGKLNG